MKAIILLRVSSKEQETNHSLDAQKSRLLEYCSRKGFTDIKEFRIVESSTRGERKQFNEVIKFIKAQKERPALITETVDRLQRSFKESILLFEMLENKEVELHFSRENLVLNEKADSTQIMQWDISVGSELD